MNFLCAALISACGGGSGGGTPLPGPLSCSVPDQNTWLRTYLDQTYFCYALAPRPQPASFTTVQDYFDASLFTGDATFPTDRYSFFQTTESYNRFFGAGQIMG